MREAQGRAERTFVRAKDGLASYRTLEDLLHGREVVAVWVGLLVPEPLVRHKVENGVIVRAGKVERSHKAPLHKVIVRLEARVTAATGADASGAVSLCDKSVERYDITDHILATQEETTGASGSGASAGPDAMEE